MSDKGLAHAIYQSKISGAEIVILSIVEHIESKESSTVTATVKREGEFDKTRGADLEIIVEVEIRILCYSLKIFSNRVQLEKRNIMMF
jgi:hypothetical protein